MKAGNYHVTDYVDGKDLGVVQSANGAVPKLEANFKDHLLLEVKP